MTKNVIRQKDSYCCQNYIHDTYKFCHRKERRDS